MNGINKHARAELELIRQRNRGFLRPQDVIKAARSKTSQLHRYFEWNDSRAAEKHRLDQAREIIQVSVIVSEVTGENIRAFVSLSHDRGKGLGYRAAVDVMNDDRLLEVFLSDARKELTIFARKYDRLKAEAEFRGVFEAIDEVVEKPKKAVKENRVVA